MDPLIALSLVGKLFLFVLGGSFVAFPIGAMMQERKAFRDVGLGIFGSVKVTIFIAIWMFLSGVCAIIQIPIYIVTGDVARFSNTFFEYYIAVINFQIFCGPCVIHGQDKLPEKGSKPCVFVMNHQSTLDICCLYFLQQYFCWISKKSVSS
jgi:hypothetical protein